MSETVSLRSAYPAVSPRAKLKVLPELDEHMRRFIALSPFLCLGSASASGTDVTPRGDSPGFVHVVRLLDPRSYRTGLETTVSIP